MQDCSPPWIRILLRDHPVHSRREGSSAPHSGSIGEEAFLGNLRESWNKAADSATSRAPGKEYLLQVESQEFTYPKNPVVHLIHRGVDTDYEEKKEASGIGGHQVVLPTPSPSKKDGKKFITTATPFYPNVLFIGGRVESSPISDDEPTMPGEEPPQREARRWRNRCRNIRRHHEAGERDPTQPVSRDEVSEVGETPDERVFRERRKSRRRDRRQAQDRDREQAEQDARLRRENPLFARNLNPDFARAMNTPSEVGGVLARIADGLPQTLDAEGFRRLLTRAANNLLPSLIPRAIYGTPSTVGEMHGAPSTLRVNDNMKMRYDAERSMIRTMVSPREVAPPELSRQQLQLVERPGDDRDGTSATPLPGTGTTTVDRRTHVEYLRLLRVSGPSSGPQTSRSPTSTNTSLSRTQEAGWPSIQPSLGPLGQLKT
jgi:hypothetical protein